MVEQAFLFLLPVEGIEPVVTAVMSTELFKCGSAEKNKDRRKLAFPRQKLDHVRVKVNPNNEKETSQLSDAWNRIEK